jgi:hypothetical protein
VLLGGSTSSLATKRALFRNILVALRILGRSESLVVFSWERQKLATTGGGLDRFRATPEGEGTSGEEKTPLAAEERPRQRPVVSVNRGE